MEGIVKLADQSLARLFTITPLGVIVNGKPTLDDFGRMIDCLERFEDFGRLGAGDAMLSGYDMHGEEFFQLFDEKSIRTKNRYMQVCREIPIGQRRPELKYSHYVEVVRIKDKVKQAKLMDEAVEHKLSSRDLGKLVDDILGKTTNYTLEKFVDNGNKLLDDWEERLNGEDYYRGLSKLSGRLELEIDKRKAEFEEPAEPQPEEQKEAPEEEGGFFARHGFKQPITGEGQ